MTRRTLLWLSMLCFSSCSCRRTATPDAGSPLAIATPLIQNLSLSDIWGTGDELWAVGVNGTVIDWKGRGWSMSWDGLSDVGGSGSNDVWAVGQDDLILHWDGRGWSVSHGVPSGEPTNKLYRVGLAAVWAANATDAWAVGLGILHWDGQSWTRQTDTDVFFADVWGSGPRDVWAVGRRGSAAAVLLHWDGLAWSNRVAEVPGLDPQNCGGVCPQAVWGLGANDVWLVGSFGLLLHWDGSKWTNFYSATTEDLMAVWGTKADDVWAVGRSGVIRHWDGQAWRVSPSGTSAPLSGVWGRASNDVWAVGANGLILKWDGATWSPATGRQTNERRSLQDPTLPCPPPVGVTPDERLESYLSCAGRKDAHLSLLEVESFGWLGGLPSDVGLRRLRNAYFARKGFRFASADLRDWFSRFAWYAPQHDRVDGLLGRSDQRRVEWIKQVERAQPEFGRRGWAIHIRFSGPSSYDLTTLCSDGRAFSTSEPSEDKEPLDWGRWRRRQDDDVFVIRWTRSTGEHGVEGTQIGCASTCTYGDYTPYDENFDRTTEMSARGGDEYDAEHTELFGMAELPELCRSEKTSNWVGVEPTLAPR